MKRHILFVLGYTGYDMRWAADELGVNASTLWRWRKAMENGSTRHYYTGQTRTSYIRRKKESTA